MFIECDAYCYVGLYATVWARIFCHVIFIARGV